MGLLPIGIERSLSSLNKRERARLELEAFSDAYTKLPASEREVIEKILKRVERFEHMGMVNSMDLVAKVAIAESRRTPRRVM